MAIGVHVMFFSPQADELRAFFKDVLQLPFFDAGDGWLIFKPTSGEIGFHPAEGVRHEISLYTDDIEATVRDWKSRGVEFTSPIIDQGYGLITTFMAPGGLEIQLYQPAYD